MPRASAGPRTTTAALHQELPPDWRAAFFGIGASIGPLHRSSSGPPSRRSASPAFLRMHAASAWPGWSCSMWPASSLAPAKLRASPLAMARRRYSFTRCSLLSPNGSFRMTSRPTFAATMAAGGSPSLRIARLRLPRTGARPSMTLRLSSAVRSHCWAGVKSRQCTAQSQWKTACSVSDSWNSVLAFWRMSPASLSLSSKSSGRVQSMPLMKSSTPEVSRSGQRHWSTCSLSATSSRSRRLSSAATSCALSAASACWAVFRFLSARSATTSGSESLSSFSACCTPGRQKFMAARAWHGALPRPPGTT
mmetsp:Transcript_8269/g.23296  ORF Transcript_8269/g.23296 Transcript_8269/m.23296 type:complete len:307 (-) Transcript_8269:24-944(-)